MLWEPELMERFSGARPVQKTVQEMIDEVESICTFVESGVLVEGDETTEVLAKVIAGTGSTAMQVRDLTILDDDFRDALARSIGTEMCTKLAQLRARAHAAAKGPSLIYLMGGQSAAKNSTSVPHW